MEASKQLKEIEKLHNKVQTDFKIAVSFYGEDPKQQQPEEFFRVFANFGTLFEVATLHELTSEMSGRQRQAKRIGRKSEKTSS